VAARRPLLGVWLFRPNSRQKTGMRGKPNGGARTGDITERKIGMGVPGEVSFVFQGFVKLW
jgi:hypothetical protein